MATDVDRGAVGGAGGSAAESAVERVELDEGLVLVCHHPREGIWCCCAEDGHAQCCCAPTLDAAVRAWVRNDNCGE